MNKTLTIDQITPQNIELLSEEEIYDVLNIVIRSLPKEQRSEYVNILKQKFDFRSISPTKNYLRKDMIMYGYKFFDIPNNNQLIMGIKRKTT